MERFLFVAKEKLEKIPKAPGVYSFLAGKNILYIGKAANLRDRVRNHFQQPSYRDDLFIDQVNRIGYIETESEIEALLLESHLIKQNLPKYNVMWKDDKKYLFVGITKEQLPRVFLTHQPQTDAQKSQFSISNFQSNSKSKNPRLKTKNYQLKTHYIGPFVDGKAIKRTLRNLRRVFPYYTARKHGPKPCQYCHLGLCPGPRPDKKEYQKNIKNLAAVLQAQKPAVLKKLQREMALVAKNQEYESARRLRDQIQDLEIVFSHAKVLRPGAEKTPLNWPETEKYLQKILATAQRISRAEAYDISNIQGKFATGSMVTFLKGKPAKEWYRKFNIHITGKPNDFAMMQELVSRRLRHEEWPYPDLMIIDGGKPQLSAALKAIQETIKQTMHKLHDREKSVRKIRFIRVAAIAKKHNELFLPRKSKPLLLRNMPQGVSNFILHMRDEAHRFAISYHRLLRKKKMLKNS